MSGREHFLMGFKTLFFRQSVTRRHDVDGVISELVRYDRRPEDLSKEIADTVSAISQFSGKSIKTLSRTILLLKLSSEELSDSTHPVNIAMVKMQDISEIRIIEGKQKPDDWQKYDIK
jgi:hypothetical protein